MAKLCKETIDFDLLRNQAQENKLQSSEFYYGFTEPVKRILPKIQELVSAGLLIDHGEYYSLAVKENLYQYFLYAVYKKASEMNYFDWMDHIFEKYNKALLDLFCNEEKYLELISQLTVGDFRSFHYYTLLFGIFYLANGNQEIKDELIKMIGRYYKDIYRRIKKYNQKEYLDIFMMNDICEGNSLCESVIFYYLADCYFEDVSCKLVYYIYQLFWENIDHNIKSDENSLNIGEHSIDKRICELMLRFNPSMNYIKSRSDAPNLDNVDYNEIKWFVEELFSIVKNDDQKICDSLFLLSETLYQYQRDVNMIYQDKVFDYLNDKEHKKKIVKKPVSTKTDWERKYKELKKHHEQKDKALQNSQIILDRQLKKQEKEISELKESLRKQIVEKDEIIKLLEQPMEEAIEEIQPLDAFANKNILMIGGFPKWQKVLASQCPGWKFVEGDYRGLHMNPDLYHAELVIFFTGYMSHSHFEKSISVCRNNKIPCIFITTTNYQKMADSISEALSR